MKSILTFSLGFLILSGCTYEASNKGDDLFNDEKYAEAIVAYNEYLNSNKSDVKTLFNRGRAYEELKQYNKARADFLQVLKMDELNFSAYASLANIHYNKEEYSKALLNAEKAIEINDRFEQAHFLVARSKHQLGYAESAMESYNTAINLDPDFGDAFLYRGALKIGLDQRRSACADFQKAKQLKTPGAQNALKKYCK